MTYQSVKRHNETVLANLEPGDLVEVPRGVYSHWAVYIGGGDVVHVTADGPGRMPVHAEHASSVIGKTFDKAVVKKDKFWKVVGDSKAIKNNKNDGKYRPLPKHEIVKRAISRIGNVGYNVLVDNCEHFANWCRYERSKSKQADTFFWVAAVVAGATGVLGAAAVSKGTKKHKQ